MDYIFCPGLQWQTRVGSICKDFLTKTCFSVYIICRHIRGSFCKYDDFFFLRRRQREARFTDSPFSNEIYRYGFFQVPKECQHDQILIFCIFPIESLFLPCHAYFDFLYGPFNNSISVNFTWFALLCHQKVGDILLFRHGALCLIWRNFRQPHSQYFSETKITFTKNAELTYIRKFIFLLF